MKRLLLAFFCAVCALNASAQEPDPNFHIYLCFGQSNMEGAGDIEAIDRNNVPERFQMMAAVNYSSPSRKMYQWYKATPPLVRQGTGLGPTDWFGRTMVSNLPEDTKVGVIVVAIGGCKIEDLMKDFNAEERLKNEADWFKNFVHAYDDYPYGRLVECAKEAQKKGVIKGMLLHQGCSNNCQQDWPQKVKKLYNDLLKDLNLKAEDVPLLVGELGQKDMGATCWGHNSIIATMPKVVPTSYVISTANLKLKDQFHFTSHGYRVLGCRYAAQMLHLQGINPVVEYTEEEPVNIETTTREGDHVFDMKTLGILYGTGDFRANRGNSFTPGADCFGGWEWLDEPLDLSGYQYLVAELREKSDLNIKLQIWDTKEYTDPCYSRMFGEGTVVVCALNGMVKNTANGLTPIETKGIRRIGLYADGDSKTRVQIKHIFATNYDPFNPNAETGIENINARPADSDIIYNMQGMRLDKTPAAGLYIRNGKKFLVK